MIDDKTREEVIKLTQYTKETVTTQPSNSNQVETPDVEKKATGNQTVGYVIYFILGFLEIFLAFRFVLKLAGANPSSGFVDFIYNVSGFFIMPFKGIFRSSTGQGIETTSVFDSATLIAMIVYALVAWGIVKLIQISSGKKQPTE